MLWLCGERYGSQTPLHQHALALNAAGARTWYADPSGRTEIEEMRAAGVTVLPGVNDIRLGIAAVNARLNTGRLKVVKGTCLNLLREAKLYRYPAAQECHGETEVPVDANNHALAALRYLVSRIDAHFLARLRQRGSPRPAERPEEREEMWTRVF